MRFNYTRGINTVAYFTTKHRKLAFISHSQNEDTINKIADIESQFFLIAYIKYASNNQLHTWWNLKTMTI